MEACIEINGWQANIRFSSSHVIPEYEKCGRLHGHTYAVHAKIWGETDDSGIVVDFSTVKNILKEIAKELDHRLIIPNKHNTVKIVEHNESIELENNGKKYVFPKEDCVLLPLYSTSAENLAGYILDKVIEKLPKKRVREIEIGVDEGLGQGARVRRKLR
ncbi:MAG TPA: 6-carboxytetrahydropterin synthase [Thermoplasmatales archaeon]|nr:6-carboxytetrahydropterin synthase [Thermoplasmatales archaeon]